MATEPAIVTSTEPVIATVFTGQAERMVDSFIGFIDRTERTARNYRNNLKQFFAWLAYSGIEAPQRGDIIRYREWLLSEHEAISYSDESGYSIRSGAIRCKPSTVTLYLQSVKQFFAWLHSIGAYENITVNIHSPKQSSGVKKDGLKPSEVVSIETSIKANNAARIEEQTAAGKDTANRIQRSTEQGKRLYAMYLLAVNAGLRTIELNRANIGDFALVNGRYFLYVWGKGHTEADTRKPLAKEVGEAIKEYLNSRTDNFSKASPLFVSTGNRSHGKRIATTTISTMLKQAMKDAGFDSDRLTAHSLRHTAARNVLLATDRNIYETQKYLRHADTRATERYLDEDTEDLNADLADRLYKHYHTEAVTA